MPVSLAFSEIPDIPEIPQTTPSLPLAKQGVATQGAPGNPDQRICCTCGKTRAVQQCQGCPHQVCNECVLYQPIAAGDHMIDVGVSDDTGIHLIPRCPCCYNPSTNP
eukprot:1639559-Amphidinium_carterae.1